MEYVVLELGIRCSKSQKPIPEQEKSEPRKALSFNASEILHELNEYSFSGSLAASQIAGVFRCKPLICKV